jgi:hypothetical protein
MTRVCLQDTYNSRLARSTSIGSALEERGLPASCGASTICFIPQRGIYLLDFRAQNLDFMRCSVPSSGLQSLRK